MRTASSSLTRAGTTRTHGRAGFRRQPKRSGVQGVVSQNRKSSARGALKKSRRKPKPEKFCARCAEKIPVGDHKIFCEPCRVEQKRDVSLGRYYRLKSESRCPHCKAPVVSSVLCESCKARMRAKPTTDRELRMMKRSRNPRGTGPGGRAPASTVADVAAGAAGAGRLHLL